MTFSEGDYFYTKETDEDGMPMHFVFRCLKIDPDHNAVHVTMFQALARKPSESDTAALKVTMMHAPIDLDGFDKPVTFAHAPVTRDDLEGYFTYLKMVDFEAYLNESGVDADELAAEAEKLFDRASALCDTEEFAEAADLYYQAYEAFPLYFEALDNAGLCFMDDGQYEEALRCFEESIEINANTFMTDLSVGQCYEAMGDNEAAKEWYKKAQALPDITDEERDAAIEFARKL